MERHTRHVAKPLPSRSSYLTRYHVPVQSALQVHARVALPTVFGVFSLCAALDAGIYGALRLEHISLLYEVTFFTALAGISAGAIGMWAVKSQGGLPRIVSKHIELFSETETRLHQYRVFLIYLYISIGSVLFGLFAYLGLGILEHFLKMYPAS